MSRLGRKTSSWCAYIVARMNASVSTGETSTWPSSRLTNPNKQANLIQAPHQQSEMSEQSSRQLASQQARHQAQQHHLGASEPEGTWQQQQQQQHQQQMGAEAPYALQVAGQLQEAQQQPPPALYQRPNLAPISAAATPPARWQTYALPTRLAHDASTSAHRFGPAVELLEAPGGEQDGAVDAPATDAIDYEDEDTAASDYVTPQQQIDEVAGEPPQREEQMHGEDEAEEEPVDDEPATQSQPPEAGNELDELSQRRLFNELQSDSNERDQDGNLLVTRRRHLINGKPVGRPRRRRRPPLANENDENNYAAESARDNRRAEAQPASQVQSAEEADFKRLVGEFEREDELRKAKVSSTSGQARQQAAADASTTNRKHPAAEALIGSNIAAGRPKWSVAEKLMRRSGGLSSAGSEKGLGAWRGWPAGADRAKVAGLKGGAQVQGITRPAGGLLKAAKVKGKQHNKQKRRTQKKKKKDEHQHRLQETLEQQQWDDDGATSADERPKAGPEAGNDEDKRVSDIVEQDQEARQLEDLSRKLMLDPEFAELTRRRRSAKLETGAEFQAGSDSETETEAEVDSEPIANLQPGELADEPAPQIPGTGSRRQADGGNEIADDEQEHDNTRAESSADCLRGCDASSLAQERAQAKRLDNLQDGPGQDDVQVPGDHAEAGRAPQLSIARVNMTTGQDLPLLISNSNLSGGWRPPDAQKVAPSNRSEPIVSEIGSPIERDSEIVSGQEDMQVEILARPPVSVGLNNFSAPVQQQQPRQALLQPTGPAGMVEFPRVASPFASGSSKMGKKKKKKVRKYSKKRAKLIDSKYKAARAYRMKQRSKQKKGQMRKKKRKSEKKLIAGAKHFAGSTRGHKKALGRGVKGARKGSTYYKDKGYKKKGFKKAYHKLETGDHKTYFDEFRDKDHNKKWKDFDDKHKYSQRKKWAGNDFKHLKHHDLKEARGKASKSGKWKESAKSEHMKKDKRYKKANKVAKNSYESKASKKKKY